MNHSRTRPDDPDVGYEVRSTNREAAEFALFEIVTKDEGRVIAKSDRWRVIAIAATGTLALVGIIAVGALVICTSLLLATAFLIFRAVASRLLFAMRR